MRRLRQVSEGGDRARATEGGRDFLARRSRQEAREAARGLVDGPGGRRGRDHRASWCPRSSPATSSSTAATPTTWTTSVAPRSSRSKRIHYVDVGTSGGVWGLERGYCMMIGGEKEVVAAPRSDLRDAGSGRGDIPRTPGREKVGGTAEQGYLHCGPNGAGHFVKMVHNGIEYGIMAAYAEGIGILRAANVGKRSHAADAETTPLRDPEHYQYDFDLRGHQPRSGGAAASSLRGCSTCRHRRCSKIPRSRASRAGSPIRARAAGRSRRRSTRPCRRTC